MIGRSLRWVGYTLVSAVHLVSLWLGERRVSVPTQVLLMPTLAVVAWTARPSRLRTWTLIALGLSFLGDFLPQIAPEAWRFTLMLGAFLLAHFAWIAGLWSVRRNSAAWRRPWALLPHVAVAVGIVAWCLPGAGVLAPALIVYALALLAAAALATGLGLAGWFGGALFILSDGLIAARSFAGLQFTHQDVVAMATYALANGLLVLGVLRAARRSLATPQAQVPALPEANGTMAG